MAAVLDKTGEGGGVVAEEMMWLAASPKHGIIFPPDHKV